MTSAVTPSIPQANYADPYRAPAQRLHDRVAQLDRLIKKSQAERQHLLNELAKRKAAQPNRLVAWLRRINGRCPVCSTPLERAWRYDHSLNSNNHRYAKALKAAGLETALEYVTFCTTDVKHFFKEEASTYSGL